VKCHPITALAAALGTAAVLGIIWEIKWK